MSGFMKDLSFGMFDMEGLGQFGRSDIDSKCSKQ